MAVQNLVVQNSTHRALNGVFGQIDGWTASSHYAYQPIACKRIVSDSAGTITRLGFIPIVSGSYKLAVYSDVDGHPGDLLCQTGVITASAGVQISAVVTAPYTFRFSGQGVFWLAANFATSNNIAISGGGTESALGNGKYDWNTDYTHGFPNPWSSNVNIGTGGFLIYAVYDLALTRVTGPVDLVVADSVISPSSSVAPLCVFVDGVLNIRTVWDKVGDRIFEAGLDRGVLYLSDGPGIPWNGLTSIVEKSDRQTSSVYYDGMKISEHVSSGDFSATMKAITYPDEFLQVEGIGKLKNGIFVGSQKPQRFNLSYRTKIGDDIDGINGYKIHLLYNLLAIPSDKTYETMSSGTNPMEFEWVIVAVPEDLPGIRPTAHFIVNSTEVDPGFLDYLETLLYGNDSILPRLLPMAEMVDLINDWVTDEPQIYIIDNEDGTWSISSDPSNNVIIDEIAGTFTILNANAVIAGDAYSISDTKAGS
jgi:hypothetical protein